MTILTPTDLALSLHVDRVVSLFLLSVICFGMLVFIVRKLLQSLPTREQLRERCFHGSLLCWRIYHSFCSLVARHSTRVVSSLAIIVVLLPVLPVVVPFVVCLLTYYFLMSLPLLKEQMNSTLRHIQLSQQVKILRLSLHQLRMELVTRFTKFGKVLFKR